MFSFFAGNTVDVRGTFVYGIRRKRDLLRTDALRHKGINIKAFEFLNNYNVFSFFAGRIVEKISNRQRSEIVCRLRRKGSASCK